MSDNKIDPVTFDYLYLGFTVHQKQSFYGAPWVAGLIGAQGIPGCNVSQACSTSTTCLYYSAVGVETGHFKKVVNVVADRVSNGPHIVWPNPKGPGGQVAREDWVTEAFGNDPFTGKAMVQTGENVAALAGVGKNRCDEVTALRYEQYADALAADRAFQRPYMYGVILKGRKGESSAIDADEGVQDTSLDVLTKLPPVMKGGVHSYGAQTHPADGNGCILVGDREWAQRLSADSSIEIQIISYGFARVDKAMMPMALVPAAQMALDRAGLGIGDLSAIKTHNPFVINDIYFADTLGLDDTKLNNYGSPLVFGHAQGPTGARCVIELIEELAQRGGGYGLFTGCAAGDTGAALIFRVDA